VSPADPDLSVVTATLGRRELLLRKLAALRTQSLPPERFEWVLVADGDDGGAVDAVAAQAEGLTLRVARLPERRGAAAARNHAAALARGRVLLFSDDDCVPGDDDLAAHLRAQATPCVAVGRLTFLAEDGRARPWAPRRVGYWHANGANTSVPADAFRAVGGFDASLTGYGGEDLLLGYLLGRQGVPARAVRAAHAVHVGVEPGASGDLAKARSAGRNAARIAARHPALAARLGVHPAWLRVKRALLPALAWAGARVAGERAYVEGALAGWREVAP
jgi:GT2 family glycosyltransferase